MFNSIAMQHAPTVAKAMCTNLTHSEAKMVHLSQLLLCQTYTAIIAVKFTAKRNNQMKMLQLLPILPSIRIKLVPLRYSLYSCHSRKKMI